jgi:osmotically-inducible protein OsmY
MNKSAALLASYLLLMQLSACTTYDAYRKCGFSGCPGDREIAAQVVTAIHTTPGISYWDIQVQSLDHVVYLSGLVDTDPERITVEQVAAQASGGKKVIDSIAVRGNVHL